MSIRNYQAWLRAARKAAKKTGGLSLPAARKAYKKMAARVGRPLKGVDVSKHPRIFKDSLPAANRKPASAYRVGPVRKQAGAVASRGVKRSSAGAAKGRIQPTTKPAARGGAVPGQAQQARAKGLVVTKPERLSQDFVEYISTPEYSKKGKGGGYLQLQIHITGPSGMKKRELDRVAIDWIHGKGTPNGITVKALGWNGKEPTSEGRGMRIARRNFSHIPF